MSTPRRIVRLTRTVLPDGNHTLDAIADDGSAWWLSTSHRAPNAWTQIQSLPPGEARDEQEDADDGPQTLHTIALDMVDSIGRSFGILPLILDTLRRAIREPMEPPAPCPHIRSSDEGTSYCALAEQTAAAQPTPEYPPSGGLVEEVAIILAHPSCFSPGETYGKESRDAIRAVADYLEDRNDHTGARWLREEVQRHG